MSDSAGSSFSFVNPLHSAAVTENCGRRHSNRFDKYVQGRPRNAGPRNRSSLERRHYVDLEELSKRLRQANAPYGNRVDAMQDAWDDERRVATPKRPSILMSVFDAGKLPSCPDRILGDSFVRTEQDHAVDNRLANENPVNRICVNVRQARSPFSTSAARKRPIQNATRIHANERSRAAATRRLTSDSARLRPGTAGVTNDAGVNRRVGSDIRKHHLKTAYFSGLFRIRAAHSLTPWRGIYGRAADSVLAGNCCAAGRPVRLSFLPAAVNGLDLCNTRRNGGRPPG